MYLNKNLPNLLVHTPITTTSPHLPATPSHTATALGSAQEHWGQTLFDVNLHLSDHLLDMQTVSTAMLNLDASISSSLESIH
ncbi:hypothetical protein CDES_12535 [Corynebacterium deserti GIMN1.010]|uniref:Uncharacterized protein n=2 Tax=Corynebacterium TaxID=1716 RepID=A0A0M4CL80_9CORY|nr:hypothetical protein CDES_12535 [Corynebacterium deserti GIMN1.010]